MVISFFRGHPSNYLLPNKAVAAATSSLLLKSSRETDDDLENRHPLSYGSDAGSRVVREALCEFIKARTTNNPSVDMVCLTNGASFGAHNALVRCTDKHSHRAFLVSPTYFLMNDILIDAGYKNRMIAIKESDKGIDLETLESNLAAFEQELGPVDPKTKANKFTFRYFLYLVPSFSNPGGITVSKSQRVQLLTLARKYDILILCDEVYEFLNFTGEELPPLLVQLDRETLQDGTVGNVIANYTVSKYLSPGLRFGWQETATPELATHLSQAGSVKSGGNPAQFSAFVVKELLDSGEFDQILSNFIQVYGERSAKYREALRLNLPEGTKILGGDGGYFLWVELPPKYNVPRITAECAKLGIVLAPGQYFEVAGDEQGWGSRCFRVCFAFHPFEEVEEAIETWGMIVSGNQT